MNNKKVFPIALMGGYSLLFLFIIVILSCCNKKVPEKTKTENQEINNEYFSLISPKDYAVLKWGDSIKVGLSFDTKKVTKIDSIKIACGRDVAKVYTGNYPKIYFMAKTSRVGQNTLKVNVYFNDSLTESHTARLVILSDIDPKKYTFRVINRFPHDSDAYTQGLIYENGKLYESTGLEKKSSLRIVNIKTGKPEKMVALDPEIFGEGIAVFKDLIYQITYKTQVGYVYDKHTFEVLRKFDYPMKEGWGLTSNGKYLIMSDGSAQLYIIDPEFFTQVDQLEIFDNKGMVDSLNELEYIDGKILANIYGKDYIVIIDAASGKITGKLDLKDLMPKGAEGDMGKVLNGIAYNPSDGHLYVTGKDWPVLYEIDVTPAL